jgi:hypothetical protein
MLTGPYAGQSGVKAVAKSTFYADTVAYGDGPPDILDTVTSVAVVAVGVSPASVMGAWTALGQLDNTISSMYIDGRDHTDSVVTLGVAGKSPNLYNVIAGNGVAGIATGSSTFTNANGAFIGGTNEKASPWKDYVPTDPESSAIIQKNAYPPGGFPTTPDAFLGWPEGKLMAIADAKTGGSRHIYNQSQLDSLVTAKKPLTGVTYVDVKHVSGADTTWNNINLYKGSGGIVVFHCTTPIPAGTRNYTSFINNIDMDSVDSKGKVAQDKNATFKGLMVFDKVFHFHMNALGAVGMLTQWTSTGSCAGNNDMTVAYSSSVVRQAEQTVLSQFGSGWRSVLTVMQWPQ